MQALGAELNYEKYGGHLGVLTWIALAFCILLVAVRAYLKSRAVVAAEVAAAEEQELPDVARHPPEP
ncbi:hypothetical protein FXO37_24419 [Capsicum annuum]|nr:hypothetical protein FXO37_24419 [Capsicum annuum]